MPNGGPLVIGQPNYGSMYRDWQDRQEQQRQPYLPMITRDWEAGAQERYEQQQPMNFWEYDREPTAQAPQQPPWGQYPTFRPGAQISKPIFEDWDWDLWAFEEMKQGLNHWYNDTMNMYYDTQETVAQQEEKTGWRGVVEPIKHALMGVVGRGLIKGAGPVFGAPEYMVERVIGWTKRSKPIPVEEYDPEKWASRYEYLSTVNIQSSNDWLNEVYGGDPTLYEKAKLMAREADRISFTWFDDQSGKEFKEVHTRLMAAEDDEEIESILKQKQNLVSEIAFGWALDPMNVATWMGDAPLATRQARKVYELSKTPIDETLDMGTAVSRSAGWWRTPAAMARKAGELVHDRLRSVLRRADSADDVPAILKNFVANPSYNSVHGQITKRVLEGMDDADILKGVKSSDSVADAIETVTKNVGLRAKEAELALIRNTRTGRISDELAKFARRVSGAQKKFLSPCFLGYNPQYAIANWFDNMRNIQTRISWRRIPGGNVADHLGFSRRAAVNFFNDQVGWMPRRLTQGFSVTPADLPVGAADEAASLWSRVWDTVKVGPTLKMAGTSEENFSALAITQSYIGRWSKNWNDDLPRLPMDLMDELGAVNPTLVEAIESAALGKYNYGQIRAELDAIEGVVVDGAEVAGRTYSPGFYIQQLTKEERAAVLAHPDILDEINRLGSVATEAERRNIIDGLRYVVGEGIEQVAKEKHLNDLRTVGWGHQDAEILRQTEKVMRRWVSQPLVQEMIDKGGHDFDLFRRIADVYGVDVIDLCEEMDTEVFSLIQRGGAPRELWEYYTSTYPFMKQFYSGDYESLLEMASEDGLVQGMELLTNLDEVTPRRSRDLFFELYKQLLPKARQQMIRDIPEVGLVRMPPSVLSDSEVASVVAKMGEWVKTHPNVLAAAEDYDELQHATTLAKRYMWYKTNQESWTGWANSSWEVDRLPEQTPNLYDIYRIYKGPLDSAIDKLDTRTVRDLDVSMEIPPSLWNRIVKWFDTELQDEMEKVSYTTARQALFDKDMAILDYPDKTMFDVLFSMGVPYEYWTAHNIWNWASYVADHPMVASWLHRYRATAEAQMEKDPLVPERLRGWIPMGVQGLTNFIKGEAWSADTEHYIKPERILMPLEQMSMFGETYMPDNYQDIARGPEWTVMNNMWSTSPILFDGIAMLANSALPWMDENRPEIAEKIRRAIPPMAQETGASYWSGTRGLRGGSIILEPLFNKMGIDIPPEGWNPEGTIHEWLGLARVQPSETYWRYQWLANLAGTGEITSAEAIEGFQTNSGRAWDLATRKAAEQNAVPSAIRWGTYAPIKVYPSEERVMRGMGLIYQDAYKLYEAGDRDALKVFYDNFPDYKFRQLAFRYWDVAGGEMTEEEWQHWVGLNFSVNDYYQERGELERERMAVFDDYLPGSPEHYRVKQEFSDRRRELSEKYGDVLDEYFDYLAGNRRKFLQWRDGPKAKAMREFLDRWYNADSDRKQEMMENLPQEMLEVATSVRGDIEPRLFTALEARQEICRRDEPVDAVYREMNNQAARVWDMYYIDWWGDNTEITVRDEYAVYLEMEFPINLTYREAHPGLDEALKEYDTWRDELLESSLDPTADDFIAAIQVLHPDWDADRIKEVRQIGASIGAFSVSDYTYIKGSDRDMVISELWRFWTTLPPNSLARKRAKEILGTRFGELFLGGEYNQISDNELALWLNLMPADWQTLVPEGRRQPFGEDPLAQLEERQRLLGEELTLEQEEFEKMYPTWVPSEPETRETYQFAPAARVSEAISEEQANEEALAALVSARQQLRSGEPIGKIELPSPAEEREYQSAYALLQRALEGETDFWNDELVKKWFPPNSPSRRFWQFWYESVPPGELGTWAKEHSLLSAILDKVSRGYVVDKAYDDALTFLIEELPSHDIGDPREYAQARAEAEQYYNLVTPELEHLRDVYFTLPKGQSRRDFLQTYPQLQGLFDAQNAFKAAHPVFTKYYDLDWVERQESYAATTGGGGGYSGSAYQGGQYRGSAVSGVTWKSFVGSAGPLVMGELLEYWAGRSELSVEARAHLKNMWEKSDSGMDFDEWLSYVKRLWISFGTQGFKAPKAPTVYLPGGGDSSGRRVTRRARWQIRR